MESQSHANDIPIWWNGTQRWMTGLTKRTTCDDVIYALLYSSGLHETDSTDNYAIFEKWREVERPLSARTKLLKVWTFWGQEQSAVKLSMRSLEDYFVPGESSLYLRSKRKHRRSSRQRSGHSTHERCQARKNCVECSRLRSLEQLVRLVVSQERKIQELSERINRTDRQVNSHEAKIHEHRVEQNGLDYVQNSYLNSHSSSSSSSIDSSTFTTIDLKRVKAIFPESSWHELEEIMRMCDDLSHIEQRLGNEQSRINELTPQVDKAMHEIGLAQEQETNSELEDVRVQMVRALTNQITNEYTEKELDRKSMHMQGHLEAKMEVLRHLQNQLTTVDRHLEEPSILLTSGNDVLDVPDNDVFESIIPSTAPLDKKISSHQSNDIESGRGHGYNEKPSINHAEFQKCKQQTTVDSTMSETCLGLSQNSLESNLNHDQNDDISSNISITHCANQSIYFNDKLNMPSKMSSNVSSLLPFDSGETPKSSGHPSQNRNRQNEAKRGAARRSRSEERDRLRELGRNKELKRVIGWDQEKGLRYSPAVLNQYGLDPVRPSQPSSNYMNYEMNSNLTANNVPQTPGNDAQYQNVDRKTNSTMESVNEIKFPNNQGGMKEDHASGQHNKVMIHFPKQHTSYPNSSGTRERKQEIENVSSSYREEFEECFQDSSSLNAEYNSQTIKDWKKNAREFEVGQNECQNNYSTRSQRMSRIDCVNEEKEHLVVNQEPNTNTSFSELKSGKQNHVSEVNQPINSRNRSSKPVCPEVFKKENSHNMLTDKSSQGPDSLNPGHVYNIESISNQFIPKGDSDSHPSQISVKNDGVAKIMKKDITNSNSSDVNSGHTYVQKNQSLPYHETFHSMYGNQHSSCAVLSPTKKNGIVNNLHQPNNRDPFTVDAMADYQDNSNRGALFHIISHKLNKSKANINSPMYQVKKDTLIRPSVSVDSVQAKSNPSTDSKLRYYYNTNSSCSSSTTTINISSSSSETLTFLSNDSQAGKEDLTHKEDSSGERHPNNISSTPRKQSPGRDLQKSSVVTSQLGSSHTNTYNDYHSITANLNRQADMPQRKSQSQNMCRQPDGLSHSSQSELNQYTHIHSKAGMQDKNSQQFNERNHTLKMDKKIMGNSLHYQQRNITENSITFRDSSSQGNFSETCLDDLSSYPSQTRNPNASPLSSRSQISRSSDLITEVTANSSHTPNNGNRRGRINPHFYDLDNKRTEKSNSNNSTTNMSNHSDKIGITVNLSSHSDKRGNDDYESKFSKIGRVNGEEFGNRKINFSSLTDTRKILLDKTSPNNTQRIVDVKHIVLQRDSIKSAMTEIMGRNSSNHLTNGHLGVKNKLEDSNDSNSDTGLSSMHSDETANLETLV